MHDQMTVHLSGHPAVTITTFSLDQAMAHYLPASVYDLHRKIDGHKNNEFQPGHYRNLDTVTECLMVLADLDSSA
jgi:hypothetical protein